METDQVFLGMKSRGIIYRINGPFNFLMEDIHLANLVYFNKEIVVLDLSSVFGNDVEFLEEYTAFIDTLDKRYELYVTGIPYNFADGSLDEGVAQGSSLMRGTWVDRLKNEKKLLFVE